MGHAPILLTLAMLVYAIAGLSAYVISALAIGAWVKKSMWSVLVAYAILLVGMYIVTYMTNLVVSAMLFPGIYSQFYGPSFGQTPPTPAMLGRMLDFGNPRMLLPVAAETLLYLGMAIGGWFLLKYAISSSRRTS